MQGDEINRHRFDRWRSRWRSCCSSFGRLVPSQSRSPRPRSTTGLKVGEKAPRFTLKDQEGKDRSLDEFLGKGKVALVFYRSADW